jgi:hypothetical protein
MIFSTSSCPFCNARLEPLASTPPADKLPCPRCGEPLPVSQWQIEPRLLSAPAAEPAAKSKTVFVLLGLMAFMAALSLFYALYTTKSRQERHPRPREIPPPLAVRSPAELAPLGFLPAGAKVVAGIQVAALAQDVEGKKLLAEPYLPLIAQGARLLKSAGLTLEDLDSAAIAVLPGAILPDVVFVARTRVPYDLEKLAQAVQPAHTSVYEKRPLYDFAWPPFGGVTLWGVDEHTLIFVVRPLDGEEKPSRHEVLPTLPHGADAVLAPSLRQLLEERVPKQSLAWAVGEPEKLLALLPNLMSIKRFAAGVYPQDGLTLLASIFTGDAKAARELQAQIENAKLPAGVVLKVEGPGDNRPEAQWVTIQVRTSAAGVRKLRLAR